MNETYTFKVAPTYTNATFARGNFFTTLEEWCGRTLEDFARGMEGRGFVLVNEEHYELSSGMFAEYTWSK